MLLPRVIPILLLSGTGLVKTRRFRRPAYVGDPCNTVRIFNELEVDELVFMDIRATPESRTPDLALLEEVASECFMPLAYGGGVRSLDQARAILNLGFEKVVVNTAAVEDPDLIRRLADCFGSQAVVVSIDVKKDLFGRRRVVTAGGRRRTGLDPLAWAQRAEACGAGELVLTSVDREGTWGGLDNDLIRSVVDGVELPVIAHGGGGSVEHIRTCLLEARPSAVGLGSMVVYQGHGMGVLVNFPDRVSLAAALSAS